MQARQLNRLLDDNRMGRMVENEALNGSDAYDAVTMLSDLRKGLWSELPAGRSIDAYRRNLQRAHVERLSTLLKEDKGSRSDVSALARAELKILQNLARRSSAKYNGIARYHLQDIDALVEETFAELSQNRGR